MSVRLFSMRVCVVLIATMLSLIFLELCLRSYERLFMGIPFTFSAVGCNDTELGWKGKQVIGDLTTDKFRIVILGDSFTEASLLPEEALYYQALKQNYDVELFISAAAGYGTVQEYLAFTHLVDQVKPNMVLLQVTANDVINNSLFLETQSFSHNNLWLRPYWNNGAIQLAYPSHFGLIRYWITQYSRLGYRASLAIDRLLAHWHQQLQSTPIESVEAQQKYVREYAEATQVTQLMLEKMRQKLGSIPLVLMPATLNEPELNQKIRGSTDNDHWLDQPALEVARRAAAGESLHEPDHTHWNAAGHTVVGEVLAQELLTHNLIPANLHRTKLNQ